MADEISSAGNGMRGESAAGWWVLATREQQEKTVARRLRDQGVEVFLPLYNAIRRSGGRCTQFPLPLFAGFLFVRSEGSARLQLLATPGVHRIVSHGEHWAVVADRKINALRQALGVPGRVEPHPYSPCGQRVRVRSGPLQGLEGFVIRRNSAFRLVLPVEVLARDASVEVNGRDIEPLKPPDRSCAGAVSDDPALAAAPCAAL